MWCTLRHKTLAPLLQCRWKSKVAQTSREVSEAAFKDQLRAVDAANARNLPEWAKREESLRKRYGAWNPTRKLSRQQISDIRELKAQWPQMKTKQLADHFHVNPESIRRILKSKWEPSETELASMNERAAKRKLQSQERKKASLELIKPPVKKYGKSSKRQGTKTTKNDKKPFTVGVGDLIDWIHLYIVNESWQCT